MTPNVPQSLRVAIVCASLSRRAGGILPIMQNHAVELAAAGLRVTAHGMMDADAPLDKEGWGSVQCALSPPRVEAFRYAPGLARSIAEARPDIVHQHALWQYPSLAVARWRRQTGRPVVISTQGMLEPWAIRNAGLKKHIAGLLFERSHLRRAACIHCSKSEVDGIRAYGLKNPIAVIPNGTALPRLDRTTPRPSWLGSADRRTMLFLGRFHPKKGIQETIEAWSILKQRAPQILQEWQLVLVGWDDGGHAERAKHLANKLGVGDSLSFPGALYGGEKAATLEHSDAFILASFSEGLPMAVLEAWAYGLPVLMTRECNLAEGFAAGAAMPLETDPETMAKALAAFMAGPASDRITMGEAGRRLVEQRFTWDRVAADLHAVYTWVLGGGPPPGCVVTD